MLFFYSFTSVAQRISGEILDAKTGKPLPFTNVFINNTTIGATTDENGMYVITARLPRNFELVASFVGYSAVSKSVSLTTESQYTVDFELEPLESMLSEVQLVSRKDKKWERDLRRFKEVFLALPDDPYSKQVDIRNPWVLEFDNVRGQKGPNHVHGFAQEALQIENEALGYEVEYYLQDYRLYKNGARYFGLVHYVPKVSDDSLQVAVWEENRELSYQGSARHLMKSLLLSMAGKQGFSLYTVQPETMDRSRTNNFVQELDKSIVLLPEDSIRRIPLGNGNYRVIWPDRVEVHYRHKSWQNDYYVDVYTPVSWVTAPEGFFDIDREGIPVDPRQLVLSGYMARQRTGRLLPNDYVSTGVVNSYNAEVDSMMAVLTKWNNHREKPYIATNKSYYYPGETVWLGGRMLYKNRLMADTLSRVLYVDVLDGDRLVQTATFPIREGKIRGGIVLVDSLSPGDYHIRAYTQWMRNYPVEDYFVRPLPVLEKGMKVRPSPLEAVDIFGDLHIQLTSETTGNGPESTSEIRIKFLDELEEVVNAEFMVSVTDAAQAVPIKNPYTLTQAMDWLDGDLRREQYKPAVLPIEYGISIAGRFGKDRKNQPDINPVTIVQGDLEDYGIVHTDSLGNFWATGLNFTDTAMISIAVMNQRQKPFGSVTLTDLGRPAVTGNAPRYTYETYKADPGSLFYDIGGEYILMEEFVKEDQQLVSLERENYGYGEPDRRVTSEELDRNPSLPLDLLIGSKFSNGKLGSYNYGMAAGEPLLIIDGARYFYQPGETAAVALQAYVAGEIASISIYTMNAGSFGLAGFAGVIMIETKKGNRSANPQQQFNSEGFQQFSVRGFSQDIRFPSEVMGRPTLYWDPAADTRDHDGEYVFRITAGGEVKLVDIWVEGTTADGYAFAKMFRIALEK